MVYGHPRWLWTTIKHTHSSLNSSKDIFTFCLFFILDIWFNWYEYYLTSTLDIKAKTRWVGPISSIILFLLDKAGPPPAHMFGKKTENKIWQLCLKSNQKKTSEKANEIVNKIKEIIWSLDGASNVITPKRSFIDINILTNHTNKKICY